MKDIVKENGVSQFWYYFKQLLCLIPIAIALHYCQEEVLHKLLRNKQIQLDLLDGSDNHYIKLSYEVSLLRREIYGIKEELREILEWKSRINQYFDDELVRAFDRFYSDQTGMFDYASEQAGGFIISTPGTASYPSKHGIRLFGAIDWIVSSPPNTVLRPTLFPGKCYAFYGDKGRILVGLGHPVVVTHVSLEYLRIGESLNSAPREFQVLGFGVEDAEVDLGTFEYKLDEKIIQTFPVSPRNQTFRSVELRVLSNHGSEEFTCLYRFRVHSILR